VLRARSAYFWLKVVETTSIPLAVSMLLYVLSAYGLVVPELTEYLGFSYRNSQYIHTHPLLRYSTTVATALHTFGGVVILARRYVKRGLSVLIVEAVAAGYLILIVSLATAVELYLIFGSPQ
jgi:hypothetical protein